MKILSTNGVKSLLLDLVPGYERKTGVSLAVAWGSTVGLMQELDAGAEADLVVLTDEAIDALVARGTAVAGSRVDLARSGIAIAVRKGARKAS